VTNFEPWFHPLLTLAVFIGGGWVISRILVRHLRPVVQKSATRMDDLLLGTASAYLPFWFLLGGISAAAEISDLAANQTQLVHRFVVLGCIVSVTLAASRFFAGVVRDYASKGATSASAASLTVNLTRMVILGLGTLLLIANLGISITPLLTALGVGSLAVALALQDTLANLFSGIHVIASGKVEVGDFVKLDSGQEGEIVDVGYRTTRIRDSQDGFVLVPNTKISQGIIVNYTQPHPEIDVVIPFTVAIGSDLEKVEKVTMEVAASVQESVSGAVAGFEPKVRLRGFEDNGVRLAVILRARTFSDRPVLIHHLIRRLSSRYRLENIDFPAPSPSKPGIPLID